MMPIANHSEACGVCHGETCSCPTSIGQLVEALEALEAIPKEELEQALADNKKDREDRRHLNGKYEPDPGVCRVCSGRVVAEKDYPDSGRIGGPPRQAFISGWHCEECQVVYRKRPPPKVGTDV